MRRCRRSTRPRATAEHFAAAFTAVGLKPMSVLSLFITGVDWDPKARVLTDQYSPANLLNSAALASGH